MDFLIPIQIIILIDSKIAVASAVKTEEWEFNANVASISIPGIRKAQPTLSSHFDPSV